MKKKSAKPIVEPDPGAQLVSQGTENTEVTYTKEKKAFMKILISCWKKCFGRKKPSSNAL
jgi:hypothetical protein